MDSFRIDVNETVDQILNRINFEGKFNILVINKTESHLQRVGAFNDSANWPIGDIGPNSAQPVKFEGNSITNSFSVACNYRTNDNKFFQFVAISPTIGSRKIGLSSRNQNGNGPAKSAWDNTNDKDDKSDNNHPYEARAYLKSKGSSAIWVYEVKSLVVKQPVPEKPPINSPVVEQPVPEKPPINSPVIEPPAPEEPAINSPVIESFAPEEVAVNPVVDRLVLKELYDMRLPAEHIARCLERELGSNSRALVEASIKQLAENGLVEKVDLDHPETWWTATPKGEDYKGDSALSIKEEILGEKHSRADKAILRALSHSGMRNLDLDNLMSSPNNIDPYSNRRPDRYRDMERYRPPMRGGRLTMESLLREVHEYELGVYSDHQKIPAIQASLQRLKDNGLIEKTEFMGWEITDKGRDFMYS